MSEIATWSMIRSKIPPFPAPTSGHENECLTKSEILSMGGTKVNGNYGDNECVMIDDVQKKELIVNPITVTLEQYSGTSLLRATSQYPVNIDVYINVGCRYSPGSDTVEFYRTVGIIKGYATGGNAGSVFRMIVNDYYFITADRDDTYIYQIVIKCN